MKSEIRYVECKDTGEAWIGYCQFSKTGLSVYFNNKVLKRRQGISGNHIDIETGEEYWVSGVKRNGMDRHWAEPGSILIDRSALDDYLKLIDFNVLPKSKYATVDLINVPNKELSKQIENSKHDEQG